MTKRVELTAELFQQVMDEVAVLVTDRCQDAFFPVEDWTLSDWSNALAGEAGEACNIIKKVRRGDFISTTHLNVEARGLLADELADVFIYLNLLAARAGIDLGAAIVKKFNEVSDKKGSEVRLT